MNEPQPQITKTFSSFVKGSTKYQCEQSCYPVLETNWTTLREICLKICPFKPDIPECVKCQEIEEELNGPNLDNIKDQMNHPESLVIVPDTKILIQVPKVEVVDPTHKQCCYLHECALHPLLEPCLEVCYEPCNAPCTGHCYPNPQCPDACDRIRQEQFKEKYRSWLVTKLNAIKLKYRAMAEECLLRAKHQMTGEVTVLVEHARNDLINQGLISAQTNMQAVVQP